ncbi:MAG: enolase C-terminal domain-like protein [Acetobacteraceae bacterium]
MKISAVRSLVVNADMRNWVFVRVETDAPGLYGWGEATLEWKTGAVVGAISDLAPLILGRDPRDIGQLVRIMIKHGFWPPGVIGLSAISGIEIALWDILGKSLGQPVWRLLGGAARERVRVYTHLGLGEMKAVYETTSATALAERAVAVVERGYHAVKVVMIPYTHYTAAPTEISHVGTMMRALREEVGDGVEIMVDFHGRPASVAAALAYIEALAPYHPMFVEEPVQPGDAEAMQAVATRSPCPIAAGERLVDPREFAALFSRRAIAIAQPDLCHCGGFSGARRIAAMAETAGIGLAPHNPLGPIATIAAWHFDIATAGFVIQEEMSGAVPWFAEVVSGLPHLSEGCWSKPEGAGLGLEVNEAVAARHPFAPEVLHATHAVLDDGTIVDW